MYLGVIADQRKEQADYYEQTALTYRDLLYRLNDDDKSVLLATTFKLGKNSQACALDVSLKLLMSSVQRVQHSFNDNLWLALDVSSIGNDESGA